jgi:hypothetical protein
MITVIKTAYDHQYRVENDLSECDHKNWFQTRIYFGGYFGAHGPHVFAAGPNLLEALETLMQFAPNQQCEDQYELGVWADAKAAIAKAKGGDQ